MNVNLSGLEDDNFKHMFAYPKKLCCTFIKGCISLVGGSVGQFAIPGALGLVVDQMNKRKQFFKGAPSEGTFQYVDVLDKTTQKVIEGSGKKGFDEASALIGFYCFYLMIVCLVSAGLAAHRGYTFNMMSEKIAVFIKYDLVWQLLSKDIGWYDT